MLFSIFSVLWLVWYLWLTDIFTYLPKKIWVVIKKWVCNTKTRNRQIDALRHYSITDRVRNVYLLLVYSCDTTRDTTRDTIWYIMDGSHYDPLQADCLQIESRDCLRFSGDADTVTRIWYSIPNARCVTQSVKYFAKCTQIHPLDILLYLISDTFQRT